METLVQTNNLTKQYGQHKAVNNVNLSVRKGEIYGLIGRNGAGKTTILRLISGLAKPTNGSISLFGQNSRDSIYMQKHIGLLIETPGIYLDMSARDNVKLKCMAIGISNNSYIAELLKNVGLSAVDKKKVKCFSVGMKQRLGIALALVGNPELVILDEPTNGLDPQGIAEIREIIVQLNTEKNITFIISSHILGELSKIATCYGIIEKGELKRQFLKTELTEDLEEYFLSLTGGAAHA
ncbi:ABC transporter ATP-binding protein [Blautia sp.]|uniref:ABC transporter ATP-binding protein n=1 Tax=Blautia sp. TaxID=1955243 RepID=UPI003AB8928E